MTDTLTDDMLDLAPALVVVADSAGSIRYFNRAAEEFTGYRRHEVVGRPLLAFVPDDWQGVVKHRIATRTPDELRDPHANPWIDRDGTPRLIEWRCTLDQRKGEPHILGIGLPHDVGGRCSGSEAERLRRQLLELSDAITDAVHGERERLAQVIHDQLVQTLVAARMKLTTSPHDVHAAIDQIDQAIGWTRRVMSNLTASTSHHSLPDRVQLVVTQVQKLFELEVVSDCSVDAALPPQVESMVLRCVRESLINVAKHAGVDTAAVLISGGEGLLRATVRDFGRGLPRNWQPGFGITSLREQAQRLGGSLKHERGEGHNGGTRVTLHLPLNS